MCEQSSSDSHALQVFVGVSHAEAVGLVQSADSRHPTQDFSAVSQTGSEALEQLASFKHSTQVLAVVSQTGFAPLQSVVFRQPTHFAVSSLQIGVAPLHLLLQASVAVAPPLLVPADAPPLPLPPVDALPAEWSSLLRLVQPNSPRARATMKTLVGGDIVTGLFA
jgi:hypothetical protein